MVENIHLKSNLAVYLAYGDVFRAQEHLQTPSELQDTVLQSRKGLLNQRNPCVSYNRIPLKFVGI